MIPFGWHRWRGETGKMYWFKITLTDRSLPADGGIYVFVRRRFFFFLEPLYVGKAASLKGRLFKHERWSEAWWARGATERHIMKVEDAREHPRIEEDLIRGLHPPMNHMLVPRHEDDAPINGRLKTSWKLRRTLSRWFGGKGASQRLKG